MKKNTLITSIVLCVILCGTVYWYVASQLFPLPFNQQIKNAELIIREKLLQISKEISGTNPLWGDRESSDIILSTEGIFVATNIARQNQSTEKALLRNSQLDAVAKLRVNDMFEKQYFEHVSPTGESASDEANIVGYEYISIGENMALGNFKGDEALVGAWMNSPGHRENIVHKSYSELGVAAKKGLYDGDEIWIAVQIFGRPLSECSEPSLLLKDRVEKKQTQLDTLKAESDVVYIQLQESGQSAQQYNEQAEKYNQLVKKVNDAITETKVLIVQYNKEVNSFNICIEN